MVDEILMAKKEHVHFRIEPELKQDVEKAVENDSRFENLSDLTRYLYRRYLDEQKKKKAP